MPRDLAALGDSDQARQVLRKALDRIEDDHPDEPLLPLLLATALTERRQFSKGPAH